MAGQGSNIAAGFPSDENVFRYEHVLEALGIGILDLVRRGEGSILSAVSSRTLPRTDPLTVDAYAASPIRRISLAPCFAGA